MVDDCSDINLSSINFLDLDLADRCSDKERCPIEIEAYHGGHYYSCFHDFPWKKNCPSTDPTGWKNLSVVLWNFLSAQGWKERLGVYTEETNDQKVSVSTSCRSLHAVMVAESLSRAGTVQRVLARVSWSLDAIFLYNQHNNFICE